MTSTQTKSTTRAKGSRTPWAVLRSVADAGDADDLDVWHEWEAASKGKRALTWSRGLRDRLGLGQAEETDEEITSKTVGGHEDTGLIVTDWAPIVARPRLGGELLTVVRRSGWPAARAFCDTNSIPHTAPGTRSDPDVPIHPYRWPSRPPIGPGRP